MIDEGFIVNGQPIIMMNINEDRKSKLLLKRMLAICNNDLKLTNEMCKNFVKDVIIEYGVHLHGEIFRNRTDNDLMDIIHNLNTDQHLDLINVMIDVRNTKAFIRIEKSLDLLRTFQNSRDPEHITKYIEDNKCNPKKKSFIILTN
jgi:hypothetical protein